MVAGTSGLVEVVWSLFWLSLFVIWAYLLITMIGDLVRSHDQSGLAKVGWLVLALVFPFFGVVIYMSVRGERIRARKAGYQLPG